MARPRKAKSKPASRRRPSRRDLSYESLWKLAASALADHLVALRQLTPYTGSTKEDYDRWMEETSQIIGLLPVSQAEHARKCLKDLHQMKKDAGEGADPLESKSDDEIKEMFKALEAHG